MGRGERLEVWRVDLRREIPETDCRRRLSATEWARAQRFRFPEHRRRYLTSHVALRDLLCARFGLGAAEIVFSENAYGKPALSAPIGGVFNLSHSDEVALIALGSDGELGVDVEQCRSLAHDDLARRNFSPAECEVLDRLAPARRLAGFFACWTRKEAYIKAKGMGLSIPLDAFTVEADPDRMPALIESRHAPADVGRFALWDLPVPPGYRATLAYAPAHPSPDGPGFVVRDWTGWQ